jgi:hypothetical protein
MAMDRRRLGQHLAATEATEGQLMVSIWKPCARTWRTCVGVTSRRAGGGHERQRTSTAVLAGHARVLRGIGVLHRPNPVDLPMKFLWILLSLALGMTFWIAFWEFLRWALS